MRPDTNSSDGSSRSGSASATGRRTHQRKQRSTERTLLGKTGVSALHEWCAKMKLPLPQFILERPDEDGAFSMSVQIQEQEHGRGRGATKGIAKQAAARQAMQSLLPGVVFDEHGLLVELPTSSSLGDLAPHLESRLAIDNQDEKQLQVSSSKKKRQASSRTWDVYPGTSTTSDEDCNDYLASRGASVCSALLHALWQIDDGIPEPPSYTYEVCAAEAKRKGVAGTTAIPVRRSSFACTARLIVKRPLLSERDDATESTTGKTESESTDVEVRAKADSTENKEVQDQFHVETLTAVGTAATKREARHAASAKLLALLFPECNGLVEVKAAAEAVREKYAADKALALQSRRTVTLEKRRKFNDVPTSSNLSRKRSSIDFAMPNESDPPLPDDLMRHLRSILGQETFDEEDKTSVDDDVVSVESLSLSDKAVSRTNNDKKVAGISHIDESLSRSLNRKKQLDERVDAALLVMNELDDEGRALPEQLSSNDVGRTVLRRAEPDDADWIRGLLANRDSKPTSSHQNGSTLGPLSLLRVSPPSDSPSPAGLKTEDSNESLSMPLRLWGSSTITLLLCRVISPKADPPLGCAVLTLGFSMEKGPMLRIAELVSEPHLPNERFIECLEKFASHMNCTLERDDPSESSPSRTAPVETVYSTEQLSAIIEAHLGSRGPGASESARDGRHTEQQRGILDLKTIGTSLQSVQEEEAEAEDDKDQQHDKDTRHDDRESKDDKPKSSKRSRVV